jgi:hypothetical protein
MKLLDNPPAIEVVKRLARHAEDRDFIFAGEPHVGVQFAANGRSICRSKLDRLADVLPVRVVFSDKAPRRHSVHLAQAEERDTIAASPQ